MTTLANVSIKDNSSWTTLLNMIYPVGSYYISNSSTSPAIRFGGTWSAITGRFPYFNAGTDTGGSNTHTHGLSNGAAMIDFMSTGTALILGKTNATQKWGSNGVPSAPQGKRYTWGESGPAEESFVGGYLTSLYGNSNSANGAPAYQTFYAWRRTA